MHYCFQLAFNPELLGQWMVCRWFTIIYLNIFTFPRFSNGTKEEEEEEEEEGTTRHTSGYAASAAVVFHSDKVLNQSHLADRQGYQEHGSSKVKLQNV